VSRGPTRRHSGPSLWRHLSARAVVARATEGEPSRKHNHKKYRAQSTSLNYSCILITVVPSFFFLSNKYCLISHVLAWLIFLIGHDFIRVIFAGVKRSLLRSPCLLPQEPADSAVPLTLSSGQRYAESAPLSSSSGQRYAESAPLSSSFGQRYAESAPLSSSSGQRYAESAPFLLC